MGADGGQRPPAMWNLVINLVFVLFGTRQRDAFCDDFAVTLLANVTICLLKRDDEAYPMTSEGTFHTLTALADPEEFVTEGTENDGDELLGDELVSVLLECGLLFLTDGQLTLERTGVDCGALAGVGFDELQ